MKSSWKPLPLKKEVLLKRERDIRQCVQVEVRESMKSSWKLLPLKKEVLLKREREYQAVCTSGSKGKYEDFMEAASP